MAITARPGLWVEHLPITFLWCCISIWLKASWLSYPVWPIIIYGALKAAHSSLPQSPSGTQKHSNTHRQRSQRLGSEVSSVLVADERTMGGESLLLKTARRVSSSYSSFAQHLWHRAARDRGRSAGGQRPRAGAANKALIDTFRGRNSWMEHVSEYVCLADAMCLSHRSGLRHPAWVQELIYRLWHCHM